MAKKNVIKSVKKYLNFLEEQGIPVSFGVLYESYAKDSANEWSDIDLLVVSPVYDQNRTVDDYERFWGNTARSDSRIEPIPVGERQYLEDDSSAIIEIARREGQIIPFAE